jgi:hypothetical protein
MIIRAEPWTREPDQLSELVRHRRTLQDTRPLHGRYIAAGAWPQISGNIGLFLVGVAGFEPATPYVPRRCRAQLNEAWRISLLRED